MRISDWSSDVCSSDLPGALENCGVGVDLGKVDRPTFILATREDHIVPWRAAYRSLQLLGGEKRFVLGASGHIAGGIGRESCREGGWKYVTVSVVAGALNK